MAKKNLSEVVIDALEDIKARDIIVLNVSKLTSMFDHIAIASGDSNRQTKALANNVITKVKEAGFHIVGSEGEGSGEWVLVDCGDIVVHIMQPAVREYYKLEELWMDGKIEWPKPKREVKSRIVSVGDEEAVPAKKVAAKKVAAKKVAAKKPAAKKPVAKKPVAKKPAEKKPVAKKPVEKKPVAKKPAAKKPEAKKPVVKTAVAKKPAAKKPAAKKPATKKTA